MEWLFIIGYIIGAVITHYIIYRRCRQEDVEMPMLNIICMLWPVALVTYIVYIVHDRYRIYNL